MAKRTHRHLEQVQLNGTPKPTAKELDSFHFPATPNQRLRSATMQVVRPRRAHMVLGNRSKPLAKKSQHTVRLRGLVSLCSLMNRLRIMRRTQGLIILTYMRVTHKAWAAQNGHNGRILSNADI